jgi:predicted TIM-barrel fold metal-dependent hydrolase
MHIFTIDHVPNNFLPLGLESLMKISLLRTPLRFILVNLNPFSNRDLFERYSNFIKISTNKTQEDVFKVVRLYYPLNTNFVVLPMDMEYMDAGDVPKNIQEQHEELYELSQHPQYGKQIIPFAAVDPRRDNVLGMLKTLVEEKGFKGIKIYPPLGYSPDHENLHPIYEYAQKKGIPVMTHCSRGGVKNKKISANQAAKFANPENYVEIMNKYPDLRICVGHCGGDEDWQRYLDQPWDESSLTDEKSWLSKILDIMRSDKYPNFFADISYTIFKFEEHSKILKVLLQDEKVKTQILFGSDFYMVEQEKFLEKRLSMSLRATLGENLFTQIAETNPRRYLGFVQNP